MVTEHTNPLVWSAHRLARPHTDLQQVFPANLWGLCAPSLCLLHARAHGQKCSAISLAGHAALCAAEESWCVACMHLTDQPTPLHCSMHHVFCTYVIHASCSLIAQGLRHRSVYALATSLLWAHFQPMLHTCRGEYTNATNTEDDFQVGQGASIVHTHVG
jgi:hypothetical protein